MVSPMQKRLAISQVVKMGLCGMARACRCLGLSASTAYYRSKESASEIAQEGLIAEVSREHPCFGYRKVTAILRETYQEQINPKKVARLRRKAGLLASRRVRKRCRVKRRDSKRRHAEVRDAVWSYDFISDVTTDGVPIRILSIIDEYSRECILLRAARSFPARRVIDCLEETMVCTGRTPQHMRSDNGPEFVAHRLQDWLETAKVGTCYIKPGSPWENGHVESFHASLRAELLNRELFFSIKETNQMLEDWREHYNYKRPHGSLGMLPPLVAIQRDLPLRATPCAPVPAGVNSSTNP